MHVLVACPHCARQFDTAGRPAGSRFRCLCGNALSVPETGGHDAAVVRCSACGAPRQEGSKACGFCGADFTLHERDLHTICPACMARVSDRARYCHHCATPLLPQPLGPPTSHPCPACGGDALLTGRELGGQAVPILECQRCAGLWLGRNAFSVVVDRARRDARGQDDRVAPAPAAIKPQEGALYRPCPECGKLMHRFNYGRRSGVIVDSCMAHGLWFDSSELDELLLWVRRAGEEASARRYSQEEASLQRQRRLHEQLVDPSGARGAEKGNVWLLDALGDLLSWFVG